MNKHHSKQKGLSKRDFRRSRGISLVELIVFMVIVSVSIAGVLQVMNTTVRHSVDPLVRKQALAIAEALLEEVELAPSTYCDPNDSTAETATSVAGCSSLPEAIGPEAGDTRPYDNVNDYNGYSMSGGIRDLTGTLITGLNNYTANITVAQQAFNGIAATESLLITVVVTMNSGPTTASVKLEGYRTRYAPNDIP